MTFKSGLGVIQGYWKWYCSKAWVWFLYAFHSNYGPILYHCRNTGIGRKSWFCSYPLHSTPPLGGSRRIVAILFGAEKLEWCGYPTTQYSTRMGGTDWWTDSRTPQNRV